MHMKQSQFDWFMERLEEYAENREWENCSEESFLEDMIFIGGNALGESRNAEGFRKTIDRLNSRQLFSRGTQPDIVEG